MNSTFHSILAECERTVQNLDEEINTLKISIVEECIFFSMAVDLCREALNTLKKMVLDTGFENQEDEIYFFKTLKPHVNSRLFYYLSLYKIQISPFVGNAELQLENLRKEQDVAKRFIQENLNFCQYCRSGLTYLDCQYFIRGRSDLLLVVKNPLIFEDPLFSTSHDYLLSRVLANEMLMAYLGREIHNISYNKINIYDNKIHNTDENPVWTDTKSALIELLYAIDSLASINKGNIDIKRLGKFFGRVLNIDLGDMYHAFGEMKMRKKERTKYLDSLKNALIKRMDESDKR